MQKLIWIGIPCLTALMLMVGVLLIGTEKESPDSFSKELKIPVKENKRTYVSRLEESNKWQYPGTSVKEWQEYEGNLFLLDAMKESITVFDKGWNKKQLLGIAGQAPWENQQTQHLWVDEEGYATIDNSHMVVKKYDHQDSLLFYHKLDEPIWDGVYLGGNKFFILDDVSNNPSFYTINARTGTRSKKLEISSIVPEVLEGNYLNIAFEGQVLRNQTNVVYMCSRTGYFFVFDLEGEYSYTGQTIDKTPPPRVTARKTGNVTYFVRDPDINSNYSGTVDETNFYVLSLIAWEKTTTLNIDMYDLNDGRYTGSLQVPNIGNDLPVEILSGKEHMYILYEGQQLVTYNIVSNGN